jgi:hypothetical protein
MDCTEVLRGQFNACRHQLRAIAIAGTGAALLIIVAANTVRIAQLSSILKLQLDQAALGAPVAQRLPLLMRKLIKILCFPERLTVLLFTCTHSPAIKIACGLKDRFYRPCTDYSRIDLTIHFKKCCDLHKHQGDST